MKINWNSQGLGLAGGLIVPVIVLFLVFFIKFDDYSLGQYFYFLFRMQVLTNVLSLCVIPNLALFFIFIWINKMMSARGVLLATFIFAFLIFGIKFLL
ncbi:MAG TPA: hypothetical protein VE912_10190 [Bacteroidales bacterium]|nr:hypothetical protein [Bacteroidales bacterium]